MEERRVVYFVLISVLSLSGIFSVAIANGPPINSDTAFVTGLNGAAARSFFKATRKSQGGLGRITVLSHPIIFPYELLDNQLIVTGKLPLLLKDRETSSGSNRTSDFGIGDLTLLAKYNLFQKDWHARTFRVAGKTGLEFPTGNTNNEDGMGILPRTLQNGKGSWNPIVGGVATYLVKRFGINAGTTYQFNTKGKDYEFGDELTYDLALSYRLMPAVYKEYPAHQINGFLELNASWAGKDKMAGVREDHTGGHLVFFSPGIQYMYQTVIFEGSFQYPVVVALYGRQLEPDWSFNFGFRWLIF